MTLPRFYNRFVDAAVPVLGGIGRDVFEQRLEETRVGLCAVPEVATDAALRDGFLLAANIAARSYPSVAIEAPEELRDEAAALVRAINPHCEVIGADADIAAKVSFAPSASGEREITVWGSGWNVIIDGARQATEPIAAPAALAAAAIGLAELFRLVFADLLDGPRGRLVAQPGTLNLVTLEAWTEGLPVDLRALDVGRVHLVGAGAVGEATVETLRATGVRGTLVPVDGEVVTTSNLQRYVLTTDLDEGALKTALVTRAFVGTGINVVEAPYEWGTGTDARGSVDVALVALDSATDRIGVQASLPRHVYNAYTQPTDIGWSRHEAFGEKACLACLYWPTGKGLSEHERIGKSLGESPERIRAHLGGFPVGIALPSAAVVPPIKATDEEREAWTTRSLLDDVLARFPGNDGARAVWAEKTVDELYREGFCGGGIITIGVNGVPEDVLVPLAYQSVLAGVMLAVQLLGSIEPALAAARPPEIEGRFDVLRGLPQSPAAPRARLVGCICDDADFVEAYRELADAAAEAA